MKAIWLKACQKTSHRLFTNGWIKIQDTFFGNQGKNLLVLLA